MATRTRACRDCGDDFPLTRIDQVLCSACRDRARDVRVIVQALIGASRPTVDAVSVVTGLPVERIRELATDGRLAGVSVDADAEIPGGLAIATSCVCQPGAVLRCAHCQMRLATTFADATSATAPTAATAGRGLHNRPSDGGGRRS